MFHSLFLRFLMHLESLWLSHLLQKSITQRIEAEKSLLRAESTKENEIHHRVKNNLQVISSRLYFQAEKFKNKECIKDYEVLEAFSESRNRLLSMALIHEELYKCKGKKFETLDFSKYIRELVEKLFQTYRIDDKNISPAHESGRKCSLKYG